MKNTGCYTLPPLRRGAPPSLSLRPLLDPRSGSAGAGEADRRCGSRRGQGGRRGCDGAAALLLRSQLPGRRRSSTSSSAPALGGRIRW